MLVWADLNTTGQKAYLLALVKIWQFVPTLNPHERKNLPGMMREEIGHLAQLMNNGDPDRIAEQAIINVRERQQVARSGARVMGHATRFWEEGRKR